MFATDRQILEPLLIPAKMSAVLFIMQETMGEDRAVLDPVKELFGDAMHEAAADVAPDRLHKIMRRDKRLSTDVLPAT